MKKLSFILCITLITVAGCASLTPKYDDYLDAKATEAHEKIAYIFASAELGEYTDKHSYGDAKYIYIEVNAHLAAARARAHSLPTSSNAISKFSKDNLIAMIDNCHKSVSNLLKIHQMAGLPENIRTLDTTDETCDLMVQATQIMR